MDKKIAKAWLNEALFLFLVIVAGVLIGEKNGQLNLSVVIALICYLFWHCFQLIRFCHWLLNNEASSKPLRFGVWQGIVSLLLDLRQEAKQGIRHSNSIIKSYEQATGAISDATLVVNEQNKIAWYNPASRLLLINQDNANGVAIEKAINVPDFHRYLAAGEYSQPLELLSPLNREISLELSVFSFGNNKKLIQARDITKVIQLERVRQDFVANVSHEMRTPLTVVYGYLEAMEENPDASLQPWYRAVVQMRKQTDRLKRIVEDLLLLSRIESGRPVEQSEQVVVPELLETIVEQAHDLSGEMNHRIATDVDDALLLLGHESELYSLFSNLVFNAVRYTPARGKIEIRWKNTGNGPTFAVKDTGIGIATANIPRLTERFYRVDVGRSREVGGTGLGLAIAKHVIKRHQALFDIKSKLGNGSTFSCVFPSSRAVIKPSFAKDRLGLKQQQVLNYEM